MNKTQQINRTTHKTSRKTKPRFIVTHEYSGSQSMRTAFEQAIGDGRDNESMSISNQKALLRDFAEKNIREENVDSTKAAARAIVSHDNLKN